VGQTCVPVKVPASSGGEKSGMEALGHRKSFVDIKLQKASFSMIKY
jgi:hypothetical protein